jgi:CRISPR-associated protein Csx10
MTPIELKITAQASLAIGRQKAGTSVSEAEQFIPGGVIRGAIAGHILRLSGQQGQDLSQFDNEFRDLFLGDDSAIFQNAYCAIAKENAHQWRYVNQPVQILPATAVSAKNNPGFKYGDHDKGGIFDTLIDRFCADQCNYAYSPSCPYDGDRVEPFGGFWSHDGQGHYRQHSTSTRFLTRVAINRQRATAQDQMLYSVEVLNESFVRDIEKSRPLSEYVAHRSQIYCLDRLAESLIAFINRYGKTFRLGGGASRGLGHVWIEAQSVPRSDDVNSRIDRFQDAFTSRWQLWSGLQAANESPIAGKMFFTIGLQSEAVLSENWQRTMTISETMLKQFTGVTDDRLQLHTAYSSYDYRGGWNSAWGLMKDVELITNRGAVYLFSTEDIDRWRVPLAQLEQTGVGDRTCEGFGQVSICNSFHTIFREQAV